MSKYIFIARRIYFLKENGNVILRTNEGEGHLKELTPEDDWKIYSELKKYDKEAVDYIQLEYKQYTTEFAECTGYYVDINTKEIIFEYGEKPPVPGTPITPNIHERMDVQENTNNEQDELIISNAANIAIMLEATGANTISTLKIEEDRVLEEEKIVSEKSVLFNVLKRSIENGANVTTTKKRIELFKRTKQLTEEEATELLAMLA